MVTRFGFPSAIFGIAAAGSLVFAAPVEAVWQTPVPILDQVLQFLANPNVAYLLLVLGLLGLVGEFAAGGTVVAGVVGAIALILALVGLGQLPTNWAGAALIVAGVIMFLADLHVSGIALSVGGVVAFALGSLLLFTPPWVAPAEGFAITVNPWLVLATTGGVTAFFVLALASVVRSRSVPVAVGRRTLIGKLGTVRKPLLPQGIVLLGGEDWSAVTADPEPIPEGATVRVVGIEGLLLRVERVAERSADVQPGAF